MRAIGQVRGNDMDSPLIYKGELACTIQQKWGFSSDPWTIYSERMGEKY
ncbi:hypothetical protein GCM10011571_35550 [Marinithermofilum abyssi]|uniref:Uncharacterized protein n=1 Tax=Marinithermofilum abyssi TaxID=1571185 RepID=A0A8J2YAT1_9BACL|nr:hypothetical protein GCM10011571_35550 [Marinithermofilum abyssi]